MLRRGLLALTMVAAAGCVAPAAAGPLQIGILQSFVGHWTGAGLLKDGKSPASRFNCTLDVDRGNRGKVVFHGTCNPLSVAGGIAYSDATGRYELALTSNTDFTGIALGRADGRDLLFAIADSDVDTKGNALTLNADMAMRAGAIGITFRALVNGAPWTGQVVFER
jgi:hypothetical protein